MISCCELAEPNIINMKYHYLQAPIPTKARMNGASLNIQRGSFRKFEIVEIILGMFKEIYNFEFFSFMRWNILFFNEELNGHSLLQFFEIIKNLNHHQKGTEFPWLGSFLVSCVLPSNWCLQFCLPCNSSLDGDDKLTLKNLKTLLNFSQPRKHPFNAKGSKKSVKLWLSFFYFPKNISLTWNINFAVPLRYFYSFYLIIKLH